VDHGRRHLLHHLASALAQVSILVVVDHGRRLVGTEAMTTPEAKVSILVVVDHGRRPPAGRSPARAGGCFNPCCSGSRSSTFGGLLDSVMGLDVSILVVVDHGRRPDITRADGRVGVWFQSLL